MAARGMWGYSTGEAVRIPQPDKIPAAPVYEVALDQLTMLIAMAQDHEFETAKRKCKCENCHRLEEVLKLLVGAVGV